MTIHNQTFAGTDSQNHDTQTGEGPSRLRREDVVRDEPIRYWSGLYRRPSAWTAPEFSAQAASVNGVQRGEPHDDPVSHGVRLGYRVVEENIRQGRRVAQQMNEHSSASGQGGQYGKDGNDIGELFGRILRYYTDLGALWSDLLNTLAANPEFVNNFLRLFSPPPSATANGKPTTMESAPASLAVSVEIIANRPSQVTVDLRPQAPGCVLATSGLYASDPTTPPLQDVQFASSLGSGVVALRIRIPEGQPPDVYTGVIVDKKTNLPQGTLSVRVASS